MNDLEAMIEKAKRQIDAVEGSLEALGENLKRAYAHVTEQLSHNPDDPYLLKKRDELDRLINRFAAAIAKALLKIGLSHISAEDVVHAIKRM